MNPTLDPILLAKIFSKQKRPSLFLFFQATAVLSEGVVLYSVEFLQRFPEIARMLKSYSAKELLEQTRQMEQELQKGYLLLYPGHDLYPRQFYTVDDSPFLLRVMGSPIWMTNQGLAVVGSREPSAASLSWMEDHLSRFLDSRFSFIVSGGARGVDMKAHLLSIRHGRPTVVLVPSGLENLYPANLLAWQDDILCGGGAIVSEYENHASMQKHYFAQRNRLISAMGCLTLIIEARRRSGTMLTAHIATDQHRPVLVLPGHPMDTRFLGSLDLLREGATLVSDAEDLANIFDSEVQTLSLFQDTMLKSLGEVHQAIPYS